MYLKNVKRFLRFFSTILIWSEAVETAADISVEIISTNVDFSLWVQYTTFKHDSNIWNCTVFLPFLELCKSIGVSVNIILLKITRPLFPIPFSAIRCNLVMGWVAQFEFSSKYVVPENDPSSWFLTPIQSNVSSFFAIIWRFFKVLQQLQSMLLFKEMKKTMRSLNQPQELFRVCTRLYPSLISASA